MCPECHKEFLTNVRAAEALGVATGIPSESGHMRQRRYFNLLTIARVAQTDGAKQARLRNLVKMFGFVNSGLVRNILIRVVDSCCLIAPQRFMKKGEEQKMKTAMGFEPGLIAWTAELPVALSLGFTYVTSSSSGLFGKFFKVQRKPAGPSSWSFECYYYGICAFKG
jgi:hypothetical protein